MAGGNNKDENATAPSGAKKPNYYILMAETGLNQPGLPAYGDLNMHFPRAIISSRLGRGA
jgi:hypothetical protein